MDALFFLRHSKHDDLEILYALRGIHRHMPWVRKVWVFGDRPVFLSGDTERIEHVSHEYVARAADVKAPVSNFFLLFYLASLISQLDFEFLWFCDDFVLIDDLSPHDAKKDRVIQDLSKVRNRGTGLWKDSLWRTYDLLQRLGYPGFNFETHVPTYFTKKRVFDAYCDFQDWVTQDRWYGMLGPTAILNHALRHEGFVLTNILDEGLRAGFHHREFDSAEIVQTCRGKTFLNFDDDAFGKDLRSFLANRFPEPSKYEDDAVSSKILARWLVGRVPGSLAETADLPIGHCAAVAAAMQRSDDGNGWYPSVVLPDRDALPILLNQMGLLGAAVEVGTLRADYAATILKLWRGQRLHCVDTWKECRDDPRYIDKNNVDQAQHDNNYAIARERLAKFGERCQIHRQPSIAAAQRFADSSLDFVYLDSRHYREAILDDLQAWAPKLKPGGILAGHDYLDGLLPSGWFEVKSSVDAWAQQHRLSVTCTGESVWRSWLIKVP